MMRFSAVILVVAVVCFWMGLDVDTERVRSDDFNARVSQSIWLAAATICLFVGILCFAASRWSDEIREHDRIRRIGQYRGEGEPPPITAPPVLNPRAAAKGRSKQ